MLPLADPTPTTNCSKSKTVNSNQKKRKHSRKRLLVAPHRSFGHRKSRSLTCRALHRSHQVTDGGDVSTPPTVASVTGRAAASLAAPSTEAIKSLTEAMSRRLPPHTSPRGNSHVHVLAPNPPMTHPRYATHGRAAILSCCPHRNAPTQDNASRCCTTTGQEIHAKTMPITTPTVPYRSPHSPRPQEEMETRLRFSSRNKASEHISTPRVLHCEHTEEHLDVSRKHSGPITC